MTNGTVLNVVKDVDGRTPQCLLQGSGEEDNSSRRRPDRHLRSRHEGGPQAGATVFVPAQRGEDGSLATGFVVVSTNGLAPPMQSWETQPVRRAKRFE